MLKVCKLIFLGGLLACFVGQASAAQQEAQFWSTESIVKLNPLFSKLYNTLITQNGQDQPGFVARTADELLRIVFQVFVEEFGEDGQGARAAKLIIDSLMRCARNLVEENGEGAKALREALVLLQKELSENGNLTKTVNEMFNMLADQLQKNAKIRESIDYFCKLMTEQGLKGLAGLGDGFRKEIQSTAQATNAALVAESDKAMQQMSANATKHGVKGLQGLGAGFRNEIVESAKATNAALVQQSNQAMVAMNENALREVNKFGEQAADQVAIHGNAALTRLATSAQREGERVMRGVGAEAQRQVGALARIVEESGTRTFVKAGIIAVLTVAGAYGVKVGWNEIERRMNIPRLVIDSSKKSWWQKVRNLFISPEHLPEMVFAPELSKRLFNIITATKNIQKKIKAGHKNVKYRNVILHGPPGTGKTMFARLLAKSSTMNYAVISGASFAKLRNGQAIIEMDKFFEWANNTEDGVVLFIDEAESFLGGRATADVTSESYQNLNNFLNHTGTRSDKVMIIAATNYASLLDQAMVSRFDDEVEIPLPEEEERKQILKMYRDIMLLDEKQNVPIFIESVKTVMDDQALSRFAKATAGLSGRELSGIINTLVSDASITDDGLLTSSIAEHVVDLAVAKNKNFTNKFKANQMAAAAA